jgi:hypothetical protein
MYSPEVLSVLWMQPMAMWFAMFVPFIPMYLAPERESVKRES